MKDELVRLGFEVGSGDEVRVPLHHVAVTGQTQQSGKTTTLEGLVNRSGRRALTFVTKRGEGSFEGGNRVQPYFRDRADWQFVDQLLSAVLQEKNKFLRPWIMKICRSTETLSEVQAAVKVALKTAKGINEGVYTQLDNYLDMIVPEIGRAELAETLDLEPGLNVMDLSEFDTPMQMLFVQSAIDWINAKLKNTVVVIPEAWEFVPEGKGSPVKASATTLVRKGATLKNFVWLDSQDMAGVDKVLLRACTTWIVGVQREANEIKRTLSNIPKPIQPKASEVALLEKGQFFACFKGTVKKVYVQPAWMSDWDAVLIAEGQKSIEDVARLNIHDEVRVKTGPWKKNFTPPRAETRQIIESAGRGATEAKNFEEPKQEAQVDEKEARELRELNKRLQAEVDRLTALVGKGKPERGVAAPRPDIPVVRLEHSEGVYETIRAQLLKDPVVLQVLATKPEIEVTVQVRTISMDGSSPAGRIARLLAKGFFDEGTTNSATRSELKRTGADVNNATISNALTALLKDGFVTLEGSTYKSVPGMKVRIKEFEVMRAIAAALLLLASAQAFAAELLSGFPLPVDGGRIKLYSLEEDGSSIGTDYVLVELWGIQAPLYRDRCGTGGDRWACGQKAPWAMLDLLTQRNGDAVNCQEFARHSTAWTANSPNYSIVAKCVLSDGETDIAEVMARQGWALAREGDRYLAAQNLAKRERLGIWGGKQ